MNPIMAKAKDYHEGKITEADFIKFVTKDYRYPAKEECPYEKGTPEWHNWVADNDAYYDPVFHPAVVGYVSKDTYMKIQ